MAKNMIRECTDPEDHAGSPVHSSLKNGVGSGFSHFHRLYYSY